ncbi:CotY/CotZ family spore coat protein [Rummeliibacillus pycnus]|uniref:CotY/CotZ family spore coat protein n=1 Tax=Rummeliibacillus pycnus TaxID=101070 RepID=UPI000C9B02E0|nr:CotY/CotZ family spore coat protein [Rummeliibacillus pycnus]
MGCGRESSSSNSGVSPIHSNNCVCDVVRAILDIQTQGVNEGCECPTNCFLEPLGGLVSPTRSHNADTRVFMLLTKDGTPFKAFFKEGGSPDCSCFSVFFRVEDVFDGCCATLRVLEPLTHDNHDVQLISHGSDLDLKNLCKVRKFAATNSCITVDLNCFCGVQCIKDVFLGVCTD